MLDNLDGLEKKAGLIFEKPPLLNPKGALKDYVDCACRKIKLPIQELQYVWTGVCNASDAMCRECQRMVPKHALVVCLGCKAVVARMAPTRLTSGFVIEPRKIYHTPKCPNCSPGVTSSTIIEAELFYRKK